MGEEGAVSQGLPHVLCADPAWQARDQLPGKGRGAAKHYATMSVDEIMLYPLPDLAEDCWLFLWRVAWLPRAALDVCDAWGFDPKSEIVWHKRSEAGRTHMGMGHYVRNAHETCIIATRGKRPAALRLSASITSTFDAPVPTHEGTRKKKHSAKPEKFFDLVERLVRGPYCEIFARRMREGWDCYGREIGRELSCGDKVIND
jgi:N6-adenosine-specific RNA methylase IME4